MLLSYKHASEYQMITTLVKMDFIVRLLYSVCLYAATVYITVVNRFIAWNDVLKNTTFFKFVIDENYKTFYDCK